MSIKDQIKSIKEFSKTIKTKKQAHDFLYKTGIITKKGNLRKTYK